MSILLAKLPYEFETHNTQNTGMPIADDFVSFYCRNILLSPIDTLAAVQEFIWKKPTSIDIRYICIHIIYICIYTMTYNHTYTY